MKVVNPPLKYFLKKYFGTDKGSGHFCPLVTKKRVLVVY